MSKIIDWWYKRLIFKKGSKLGIDIDGDIVVVGKRHPKRYYVNIMRNEFKRVGDFMSANDLCDHISSTDGSSLLITNNDTITCSRCGKKWISKM